MMARQAVSQLDLPMEMTRRHVADKARTSYCHYTHTLMSDSFAVQPADFSLVGAF